MAAIAVPAAIALVIAGGEAVGEAAAADAALGIKHHSFIGGGKWGGKGKPNEHCCTNCGLHQKNHKTRGARVFCPNVNI